MMPKPKNIIIFAVIGVALFSAYFFFFRKSTPDTTATLVSSPSPGNVPTGAASPSGATSPGAQIGQDFLNLLLNVKTIKLNTAIFTDPAFNSLHDSSITLIPDGTEGRPNPFAPIGVDSAASAGAAPAVNNSAPATSAPKH